MAAQSRGDGEPFVPHHPDDSAMPKLEKCVEGIGPQCVGWGYAKPESWPQRRSIGDWH